MDKGLITTVLIVVVLVCAIITVIGKFFKLAPKEQLAKIQTALLALVVEAERLLQSKTGEIKRSLVYNWIKDKFPFLIYFLSEEQFDKLLNNALDKMEKALSENDALYEYVYGKKKSIQGDNLSLVKPYTNDIQVTYNND